MDTTSTARIDTLLLQASRHLSEGAFDEALALLREIRSLDARHELAEGMLGAIHAQLHAFDEAIDCFGRVLAINPANHLARFQLGCVHMDQQRPREALEAWGPCLREPTDYVVHFHAGLAYMRLDKVDDARLMFGRAARLMPPDHALRAELTQMMQATGARP